MARTARVGCDVIGITRNRSGRDQNRGSRRTPHRSWRRVCRRRGSGGATRAARSANAGCVARNALRCREPHRVDITRVGHAFGDDGERLALDRGPHPVEDEAGTFTPRNKWVNIELRQHCLQRVEDVRVGLTVGHEVGAVCGGWHVEVQVAQAPACLTSSRSGTDSMASQAFSSASRTSPTGMTVPTMPEPRSATTPGSVSPT